MEFIAKVALELILGAAYTHFGVCLLSGEMDLLPAFERLSLPPGVEFACGVVGLAAGAGLIVGIGFPEAALAGSAAAELVLVVALISYLPNPDPPFARIYGALALIALVALVWAVHWPDQPLLSWLPS